MKLWMGSLAAAVALSVSSGAGAQSGGKIYFANVFKGPVQVSIDGGEASTIGGYKLDRISVTPGSHTITVKTSGGETATGTWVFNASELAEAKGGRYWCVAVGPRDTDNDRDAVLIKLPQPDCVKFVEAGN